MTPPARAASRAAITCGAHSCAPTGYPLRPCADKPTSEDARERAARSSSAPSSEIDVQTRGGNERRAAVAVVSGVMNVLDVEREIDAAADVGRVVCLDDARRSVAQRAVADQEAQAAGG